MKIVCAEDCGNAPKKRLLKELYIDFWGGEGRMLFDNLTEDAVWSIVGGPQYVGKEAIKEAIEEAITEPFEKSRDGRPSELVIHNIITHGNTAAANVTVKMPDGSRIEYCDVYRFGGFGPKAKIKEVTSYVIPLTG